MLTHSLLVNYRDLPARVHQLIVSELVQVNPDNSLALKVAEHGCSENAECGVRSAEFKNKFKKKKYINKLEKEI